MTNLKQITQDRIERLSELNGKKVLIFGDIGLDEYVQGDVSRISPEAPVPVVDVHRTDEKLGLSANVAANVKAMGGEPMLFSVIGDDRAAETLKNLLARRSISSNQLMVDPSRETTTKLRVMAGHHHIVRVDYENKTPVHESFIKKFSHNIEEALEQADAVILQDYAKGLICESTSQFIIQQASKKNKQVLVDPYRTTPLSYYQGASFMTPNRDEAFELAKQISMPEIWQNVDAIGAELMRQTQSPHMVITLGSEGMKIFNKENCNHLPTFAKKVFDVTGAGDTVIAAFALGIAAGWPIEEAGVLANLAAGVVVGQVGAVACTQEDLKKSQHQMLANLC